MKIKDGFVKCKVGEKYLVVTTGALSAENNIMIELNETSSEIWDFISQGLSADEIAKKISEEYGISLEKAENDVNKLIDNMAQAGVLE